MKIINLKDFHSGWIIGNFLPSICKTTDCDIGILKIKKDTKGDGHYHKNSTEYNFIISGAAIIENNSYSENECFIYEPYDKSYVYYPCDTVLLVVKTPSMKNDKYFN